MPKYALVEEAAKHCWGKSYMDRFKIFFDQHADVFVDAPMTPSGEQNLEMYALFQKYLELYEETLSEYVRSLDVSVKEFYSELAAIKDDPEIKDKKLLHFVNYLIASTDYESFYKVMARAAKRQRQAESKSEGKSDYREGKGTSDEKGCK